MGYKIYEHAWASYFSTDVIVDGRCANIVFSGSSKNNPIKITAKYATNSEAIQRAIEARDDFGKEIRLFQDCSVIEETPMAPPVAEAPKPTVEAVTAEPEVLPSVEAPEGFEAVAGISTAVEAKNYLLDKFSELRHSDVKNTAMIKEVAAKYKIVFTELA